MVPEPQIAQALELLRAGKTTPARRLLLAAVKASPDNTVSWLWLAQIEPTLEKQRACLARALAINPGDPVAQRLHAELEAKHAERLKSGGLQAFLMVTAVYTAIFAMLYLAGAFGSMTWLLRAIGTGSGLATVVFVIAAWKWKKWGVAGLVTCDCVWLGMNLIILNNVSGAFLGFLHACILAALVVPKWELFE